ncbi:MAG: hypothetical protein ACE5KH_04795, partial [Candidatus Geothermarchaeales archaeon]
METSDTLQLTVASPCSSNHELRGKVSTVLRDSPGLRHHRNKFLVGTPDALVEQIGRYRDMGVSYLALHF